MASDDLISAATALSPLDAQLRQWCLQDHGVPSQIVTVAPRCSGSLPERLTTEVWVEAKDLIRARNIMKSHRFHSRPRMTVAYTVHVSMDEELEAVAS